MLNYTTYVNTICTLLVATTSDANFATVLPNGIEYAELKCYRDLDLLNTIVRDNSAALTAGSRNFALPSTNGTPVVTEQLNVITPASTTTADLGTRNPLLPVSRESIDFLYPSVAGSTVPQYFAMVNQTNAIVAPWPDQNYTMEFVGTIRPATLTAVPGTTLLSVFFPDLFVAASMVYFTGYQRDFGQQSTDPQAAMSWEDQYQRLLKSSQIEEARKKFAAEGWSPKEPSPIATPPRS